MKLRICAVIFSCLVLLALIGLTSSANILMYYGLSGHSHISSIWPVYEELGNRGHNLTLLTLFPPTASQRHPAIKVVQVQELFEMMQGLAGADADLIQNRFDGQTKMMVQGLTMGVTACSVVLSSPSTRALVYNSSFDLVIVDTIANECAVGLAVLQYKCPFMVYNAVAGLLTNHDDYGVSDESWWVPEMETGTPPVTFLDRVTHVWYGVKWALYRRLVYFPALAQTFVDNLHLAEPPNFLEIFKRTSLVLMNSHPAHSYAMSLPPLFVPIAGVGLQQEVKPLPGPLEKIVSSRDEGFIYISFGTLVLIGKGRPELRSKFFNVLGSMPDLRFVWKWDDGNDVIPADAPANIHFASWLPQQELLGHPRVRGFITHGGMNSINEAVHHGVPMLVFPIMGDQDYNAHMVASKGLGLVMEITTFTEEELRTGIDQLLNNDTLRGWMKKASTVFRDRPMKPVDTAVWWIEYVLRHGHGDSTGTSFMMPGAVSQTWYERRLLDVWFFVFGVCAILLVLFGVTIRVAWNLFSWSRCNDNGTRTRVLGTRNGNGKANKLKTK